MIGRPSRAPARSSSLARGLARVHPRPDPQHLRLEADAVELGGHRRAHRVERLAAVGAHVAQQLAVGGHDVERVARADHGRDHAEPLGAVRVVVPGDLDRGRRQRQQRVPAPVGGAARMRRAAGGAHPHRPGGLAVDDHGLVAVGRELAALEAQAGVVGGEPLDVDGTRAGATPRR